MSVRLRPWSQSATDTARDGGVIISTIAFEVVGTNYFGMLPGQSVAQFKDILAKLTSADREEMVP